MDCHCFYRQCVTSKKAVVQMIVKRYIVVLMLHAHTRTHTHFFFTKNLEFYGSISSFIHMQALSAALKRDGCCTDSVLYFLLSKNNSTPKYIQCTCKDF